MNVSSMTKLAESLGEKVNTLYVDWSRRDTWLPHFAPLLQNQTQLHAIFHELKTAREEAWKLYELAKNNENYMTAAVSLKETVNTLLKEITLRQSLGLLERAPLEVKQLITVETERERARHILSEMSADELEVLVNALSPFEGLIDLETAEV
jgi:hypothetical protein